MLEGRVELREDGRWVVLEHGGEAHIPREPHVPLAPDEPEHEKPRTAEIEIPSAAELMQRVDQARSDGRLEDAIVDLRTLVEQHGQSTHVGAALFTLAWFTRDGYNPPVAWLVVVTSLVVTAEVLGNLMDQLQRSAVTDDLMQPTRTSGGTSNSAGDHTATFRPAWPCSRWGLPGRWHCCRRRWSLTPPFHPRRKSRPFRQCTSLLHLPSGHPARPLAGTSLFGVRTFLGPGEPKPRSSNQLATLNAIEKYAGRQPS